jgi:hypothetical protein
MRKTAMDHFLEQPVNYGGFAVRRGDVYFHFLSLGFSKKDADANAFRYAPPVDVEPISLEEFTQIYNDLHKRREG